MTRLNNLNISKKLAAAFAVVVATMVAMSVTVFVSLTSIKGAVELNDQSATQLKLAEEILNARVERQNAIRGLVASGDPAFLKKIDSSAEDYARGLAELKKAAPEDVALIAAIDQAAARVTAEEAPLIAAG